MLQEHVSYSRYLEYNVFKVNEDIKKLANTKKMSENSYKIMIRKLEANLSEVLQEVDRSGRRLISFEMLGRIFTMLDVFRAIRYDDNCNCIDSIGDT